MFHLQKANTQLQEMAYVRVKLQAWGLIFVPALLLWLWGIMHYREMSSLRDPAGQNVNSICKLRTTNLVQCVNHHPRDRYILIPNCLKSIWTSFEADK